MAVDRGNWPVFYRLGLWSVRSAGAAWAYFWGAILLALGSVAYGFFVDPFAYWGLAFLISAFCYYISIQWVNRNAQWG